MADDLPDSDDELWLGYNGVVVPFAEISAMLLYQPVWDRRLQQQTGRVPQGVQTVVLLSDGRALPARIALADLHCRWVAWQRRSDDGADSHPSTPSEEA